MFLTDVEIEKRIMLAIEKDQSFRSCSTMSTGAHSSGEGELSSSVEGGSPKAMMQALIRDLSFWDAIPPIQVVPQPLPQTNQSSKRRSSSIQPERTSSSSSRQRKDYYRSVSREERNSTRSSSDATIENHYANNGSAGWGRSQPAWKSAVDPMTGRTYWYDAVTRRTQWDKPHEVRQMEKRKKAQRRKRDMAFFREMEVNILRSLSRGEVIPGIPTVKLVPTGPPLEPTNASAIGARNVRTLSKMDDTVLAELRDDVITPEEFNRAIQAQTRSKPRSSSRGRPPLPNPNRSFNGSVRDRSQSRSRSRSGRSVTDTLDTVEAAVGSEKKKASSSNSSAPQLRTGRSKPPPTSSSSRSTTTTSGGEDPAGTDSLAGEHLLDGPLNSEITSLSSGENKATNNKNHIRRNTGGTIYVKSTMANPDVEATIKCVCGVYRAHMVQASEQRSSNSPVSVMGKPLDMEVFHDLYHLPPERKLSKQQREALPNLSDIVEFYQEFYRRSQMEHDTIIMSLIYVERLIKTANVSPSPENWRSILFSCMVLASKVWDDLSMWNIDFSNVASAHSQGLSLFTLQRVNQLELVLLKSLNFDVKVPASEYAKYYFLIRTMLMRSGLLDDAVKPLGKEDALVLENRTSHYQDSKLGGDQERDRRSKSMYDYSWFEKNQQQDDEAELGLSPPDGPVLKDKICLEQLVNMSNKR